VRSGKIDTAAVLVALIALGLWLGRQDLDRVERITGERPTLYDVLAPW